MPERLTFEEFEQRARDVYERVPPEYRVGVDGLVVSRPAVPHPEIPDVYTLGECATGELDTPGDFDSQWRSLVVLHYGSFVKLAKLDAEFDWDYEIWETIVHEIRHHRESAAGEDALEDVDYAEDENFRRLEGEPFDPYFYRAGEPSGEGAWEVGGEVFVERSVTAAEWGSARELEVDWQDATLHLERPAELADVQFVALEEVAPGAPPLTVVLVRRRGVWESVRAFLRGGAPHVVQSEGRARVERHET